MVLQVGFEAVHPTILNGFALTLPEIFGLATFRVSTFFQFDLSSLLAVSHIDVSFADRVDFLQYLRVSDLRPNLATAVPLTDDSLVPAAC